MRMNRHEYSIFKNKLCEQNYLAKVSSRKATSVLFDITISTLKKSRRRYSKHNLYTLVYIYRFFFVNKNI